MLGDPFREFIRKRSLAAARKLFGANLSHLIFKLIDDVLNRINNRLLVSDVSFDLILSKRVCPLVLIDFDFDSFHLFTRIICLLLLLDSLYLELVYDVLSFKA
jgi:hypothetical protein